MLGDGGWAYLEMVGAGLRWFCKEYIVTQVQDPEKRLRGTHRRKTFFKEINEEKLKERY